MTEYVYTRELVNFIYNINNINRIDAGGGQIKLAKEIEDSLPGKVFNIICNAEKAIIKFDLALDLTEKILLDTVVSNHKNNL